MKFRYAGCIIVLVPDYSSQESDEPDSVLAFLSAMDEIDKKIEKSKDASPPKKVVKEDMSFLSEISRPDKVIAAKVKTPTSPTKTSPTKTR